MKKYMIEIQAPDDFGTKLVNLTRYIRKKLLCEYRVTCTEADGKQKIMRSKNYKISHSSTSKSS